MIFTRLRRAFSCGFSHPSGSRHLLLLERLPASLSRPREDSGIERNCQIGDRLPVGAASDRPRAVYNPFPRIITLGLVGALPSWTAQNRGIEKPDYAAVSGGS